MTLFHLALMVLAEAILLPLVIKSALAWLRRRRPPPARADARPPVLMARKVGGVWRIDR